MATWIPERDELADYLGRRFEGTGFRPSQAWLENYADDVRILRVFVENAPRNHRRELKFQASVIRAWIEARTGREWVVVVYPKAAKAMGDDGGATIPTRLAGRLFGHGR